MKPKVNKIKNIKIDHVAKKPPVKIEIDHGNRYIISRSKTMNRIAIK
jgi:hypothetical protein